jgi:predicted HAD superfamily Cof-like phosphohydrolase
MSTDPETASDFYADIHRRLDKIENSIARAVMDRPMTTHERIRQFNLMFDRPVNVSYTPIDIETRELLGSILLEEVVEYITKGLGCEIISVVNGVSVASRRNGDELKVQHVEGEQLDPLEIADGLGDVDVVIHFNAHWHGIHLDKVTAIIDDSNKSKLGPDGKPIINGVTPGYRISHPDAEHGFKEPGYDSTKPIGKILKGPDFYPPTAYLSQLIATAGNNSEDS